MELCRGVALDDPERAADRARVGFLARGDLRPAENRVERRAQLVRHDRQEFIFQPARSVATRDRLAQRPLERLALLQLRFERLRPLLQDGDLTQLVRIVDDVHVSLRWQNVRVVSTDLFEVREMRRRRKAREREAAHYREAARLRELVPQLLDLNGARRIAVLTEDLDRVDERVDLRADVARVERRRVDRGEHRAVAAADGKVVEQLPRGARVGEELGEQPDHEHHGVALVAVAERRQIEAVRQEMGRNRVAARRARDEHNRTAVAEAVRKELRGRFA